MDDARLTRRQQALRPLLHDFYERWRTDLTRGEAEELVRMGADARFLSMTAAQRPLVRRSGITREHRRRMEDAWGEIGLPMMDRTLYTRNRQPIDFSLHWEVPEDGPAGFEEPEPDQEDDEAERDLEVAMNLPMDPLAVPLYQDDFGGHTGPWGNLNTLYRFDLEGGDRFFQEYEVDPLLESQRAIVDIENHMGFVVDNRRQERPVLLEPGAGGEWLQRSRNAVGSNSAEWWGLGLEFMPHGPTEMETAYVPAVPGNVSVRSRPWLELTEFRDVEGLMRGLSSGQNAWLEAGNENAGYMYQIVGTRQLLDPSEIPSYVLSESRLARMAEGDLNEFLQSTIVGPAAPTFEGARVAFEGTLMQMLGQELYDSWTGAVISIVGDDPDLNEVMSGRIRLRGFTIRRLKVPDVRGDARFRELQRRSEVRSQQARGATLGQLNDVEGQYRRAHTRYLSLMEEVGRSREIFRLRRDDVDRAERELNELRERMYALRQRVRGPGRPLLGVPVGAEPVAEALAQRRESLRVFVGGGSGCLSYEQLWNTAYPINPYSTKNCIPTALACAHELRTTPSRWKEVLFDTAEQNRLGGEFKKALRAQHPTSFRSNRMTPLGFTLLAAEHLRCEVVVLDATGGEMERFVPRDDPEYSVRLLLLKHQADGSLHMLGLIPRKWFAPVTRRRIDAQYDRLRRLERNGVMVLFPEVPLNTSWLQENQDELDREVERLEQQVEPRAFACFRPTRRAVAGEDRPNEPYGQDPETWPERQANPWGATAAARKAAAARRNPVWSPIYGDMSRHGTGKRGWATADRQVEQDKDFEESMYFVYDYETAPVSRTRQSASLPAPVGIRNTDPALQAMFRPEGQNELGQLDVMRVLGVEPDEAGGAQLQMTFDRVHVPYALSIAYCLRGADGTVDENVNVQVFYGWDCTEQFYRWMEQNWSEMAGRVGLAWNGAGFDVQNLMSYLVRGLDPVAWEGVDSLWSPRARAREPWIPPFRIGSASVESGGKWPLVVIQRTDTKGSFKLMDAMRMLGGGGPTQGAGMSLAAMGKAFDVRHQKKQMDHERIRLENAHEQPELAAYIANDVLCAYEIVSKFGRLVREKWKVNILHCPTSASLGCRIWGMRFYDPLRAPIVNLEPPEETFVGRAKKGGRVQAFRLGCVKVAIGEPQEVQPWQDEAYRAVRPVEGALIVELDCNSEYPYAACWDRHPVGRPMFVWPDGVYGRPDITLWRSVWDYATNLPFADFVGFVEVKIWCDDEVIEQFRRAKSSREWPFIPAVGILDDENSRLLFPVPDKTWANAHTLVLPNATFDVIREFNLPYRMEPIRALKFGAGSPLQEIIVSLNAMKEVATGCWRQVLKLLLNCLYGRPMLRRWRRDGVRPVSQEDLIDEVAQMMFEQRYSGGGFYRYPEGESHFFMRGQRDLAGSLVNLGLGVSIAAQAQKVQYRMLHKIWSTAGCELLYGDTDSVVAVVTPELLTDSDFLERLHPTKLGYFKDELCEAVEKHMKKTGCWTPERWAQMAYHLPPVHGGADMWVMSATEYFGAGAKIWGIRRGDLPVPFEEVRCKGFAQRERKLGCGDLWKMLMNDRARTRDEPLPYPPLSQVQEQFRTTKSSYYSAGATAFYVRITSAGRSVRVIYEKDKRVGEEGEFTRPWVLTANGKE